jgi:predicted DNA binding CopG/RHH family protein
MSAKADKPRKRMGRPPYPPEKRRSIGYRVRLTPGEAEAVRAKATAAGLPVAEYMRRAILGTG